MRFMEAFEGFILTGGASSRMGRDKATLSFGTSNFAETVARALGGAAAKTRSIGGEQISPRIEHLSDALAEPSRPRGAIVGLYTALRHAGTEWIAVAACDLPFVTGELFRKLASFRGDEFDAVVPRQPDGRTQPLCALYRRAPCLNIVEKALQSDDWSLKIMLERSNCRFVEFEELSGLENAGRLFTNVNTPEEYREALKQAG